MGRLECNCTELAAKLLAKLQPRVCAPVTDSLQWRHTALAWPPLCLGARSLVLRRSRRQASSQAQLGPLSIRFRRPHFDPQAGGIKNASFT